MEEKSIAASTEQQATTQTPAEKEGGERLFTQEEVNKIVGERLARYKAKTEPAPEDQREQALKARETRLECREYIQDKGYPRELLDILDTADGEKFKAAAEQLAGLTGSWGRQKGFVTVDMAAPLTSSTPQTDSFAAAFKPKI